MLSWWGTWRAASTSRRSTSANPRIFRSFSEVDPADVRPEPQGQAGQGGGRGTEEPNPRESKRVAAKTWAVAEVNGRRDLLPEGATDGDIGASLARMWDNLDGAPCRRLERILGILAVVRAAMGRKSDVKTFEWAADLPASALRFKRVPAIEAPSGTRVVRTSSYRDEVMDLHPPPEEVTDPFYDRRGWWVLDFSIPFPSQVERLLRGDRP